MISKETVSALENLGRQLRALRIERNDRQSDFAARLGVSVPTLRKLEHGDASVAIGPWVDAIWLLGRLEELAKILAPRKSMFDQWESRKKPRVRERARKK
jgi:transcriptional regulator with XRE-family HTH domain